MHVASADCAASASAVSATALLLPAELGIEQVEDLKTRLGGVIDAADAVVLQAAGVERVHSAALQLLCLFCRDRQALGRKVEFAEPSAPFRAAAVLLGAAQLLQIARNAA